MLLLSAVELVRRFLWAIYRVEWEHIQKIKENAEKAAKIKHDRMSHFYADRTQKFFSGIDNKDDNSSVASSENGENPPLKNNMPHNNDKIEHEQIIQILEIPSE